MKKTNIILFVILLSGCVAERKGEPAFEEKDMPKCPEVIKTAAQNLEQLGIDKAKVKAWMKASLSAKVQPCTKCQELNEAVYVLKDEKGSYKAAMAKLIQAVEKPEPNAPAPNAKQKKEMGNGLMENKDVQGNILADQYIKAAEVLQSFLVTEIKLPAVETKNFILDNYFVPLIKNEENKKDLITSPAKPAEQKT